MICRECDQFERNDRTEAGYCRRWKLTRYPGELCHCDPCRHCQHFSEYYDSSTGITDYGCSAEREFPVADGEKPCKYFRPILASDGLLEQIAEEEDERFWTKQMKAMEEME